MKKYDVVVVGGGFAGVCAAIAAAREGSRVLLVEKGIDTRSVDVSELQAHLRANGAFLGI